MTVERGPMHSSSAVTNDKMPSLPMSNQNLPGPGYRFQVPSRVVVEEILLGEGPGRRLRKNVANIRRHVDYVPCCLKVLQARFHEFERQDREVAQPDELYQNCTFPPCATPEKPVDCVNTKFVRAAMNKVKCPVYTLAWTPEGKRLITGASSGEFTLWNGVAFNFETILQAHDGAVRAMVWTHNGQWMASGDASGFVKYWQPNMNNVHMFMAHNNDAVRGLKFSPTDVKFASASDDNTGKIWDFARCVEEFTLRGHGSEVRCIDWHPSTSLICTGSRDTQQPVKLWDASSGKCVSTLQHHKSSVMAVEFNQNGNWLLTASRDQLVKMYDIRTMKVLRNFRGHKKEVTSVAWHPVHEGLFVTGGGDGSIAYWLADNDKEIALLEHAHDQAIWCMKWHPLGHILATGSNDNNTKFWARNRPGDTQEDIFGLASFQSTLLGSSDQREQRNMYRDMEQREAQVTIPGMGLDDDVYESMNRDVGPVSSIIVDDMPGPAGARRTLIKQPPPKRAQRQFERIWNVAKPGASTHDNDNDFFESEYRRDTSLLGPAPPSNSLLPTAMLPASTTIVSAQSRFSSHLSRPPPFADRRSAADPADDGGAHSTSWRTQASSEPKDGSGDKDSRALAGGAPAFAIPPNRIPAWPPGIPMPPNIAALHAQSLMDEDLRPAADTDYRKHDLDEDLRPAVPMELVTGQAWYNYPASSGPSFGQRRDAPPARNGDVDLRESRPQDNGWRAPTAFHPTGPAPPGQAPPPAAFANGPPPMHAPPHERAPFDGNFGRGGPVRSRRGGPPPRRPY